eukprot:Skav225152  [mRNA]  locus=scaffold1056:282463:283690:- [translate_table: standard]
MKSAGALQLPLRFAIAFFAIALPLMLRISALCWGIHRGAGAKMVALRRPFLPSTAKLHQKTDFFRTTSACSPGKTTDADAWPLSDEDQEKARQVRAETATTSGIAASNKVAEAP